MNESSHPEDPFEAEMRSYDAAIVAALEKFDALAQQISSSSSESAHIFNADESAIDEGHASSFSEIKADVTAHVFNSLLEDSNFKLEDSDQEDEHSLFDALSEAKADVASNTYFYMTSFLEKIISFEVKNASKAANHWVGLVKKTKSLIEFLEKYQSICTNHFSSKRDPLEELAYEIDFYKARLAEYETEESTTDALVARNNYLSAPENSQDRIHQGSALLAQSTQVPVNFHEAAEAYRSISKDISADDIPADDITAFHEMMALWCEALAAEIAITAVSDAALVHEIKWPHEELSEKTQEAYDTVITACKNLAPKCSDEELESEQHEIERYVQEATNRKQLLEVQLKQGRVNSLLPEKLTPASSESEKFLHHENLFRQLQSFQTISQRGLEQAPERLKSLLHQFNRLLSKLIMRPPYCRKQRLS